VTTEIPKFNVSHGQVLWALSHGIPASPDIVDQVRYLRLLGVPFGTDDLGVGSGNRISYRFEHLIELGLALFGSRRGLKPKDIAGILTKNRAQLRRLYRQAFQEQPAGALKAEWVKSRGRIVPVLGHEIFLRLHDRHSETPGKFDVMGPDQAVPLDRPEVYPGEQTRTLVPLTRLVLELVAWAMEAPATRPGPH
jgi:hypothetical protein